MKTQYIKKVITKINCRHCGGTGTYVKKEYHNQHTDAVCYLCDNGKIDAVEETDVTEEIEMLQNFVYKTPAIIHRPNYDIISGPIQMKAGPPQTNEKGITVEISDIDTSAAPVYNGEIPAFISLSPDMILLLDKMFKDFKTQRYLHERMKLAVNDQERAEFRKEIVKLDDEIEAGWEVIDNSQNKSS
jgi:hypothetical protein